MTATLSFWPDDQRAVLELGDGAAALELVMYFDDDGVCTHAVWVLSRSRQLLGWASVGVA